MIDLIKRTMTEFPMGSLVYHKANCARGVVLGYTIRPGFLMIDVSDAFGATCMCTPCSLTTERTELKPDPSDESEAWKAG